MLIDLTRMCEWIYHQNMPAVNAEEDRLKYFISSSVARFSRGGVSFSRGKRAPECSRWRLINEGDISNYIYFTSYNKRCTWEHLLPYIISKCVNELWIGYYSMLRDSLGGDRVKRNQLSKFVLSWLAYSYRILYQT